MCLGNVSPNWITAIRNGTCYVETKCALLYTTFLSTCSLLPYYVLMFFLERIYRLQQNPGLLILIRKAHLFYVVRKISSIKRWELSSVSLLYLVITWKFLFPSSPNFQPPTLACSSLLLFSQTFSTVFFRIKC